MKTIALWMVGFAMLTLTGCGESPYLRKDEAPNIYMAIVDADAKFATQEERVKTVAREGLEEDQRLASKVDAQQGQINDLKGTMESSHGTLLTFQGTVDRCLEADRALASRMGAQEGQSNILHECLQQQNKAMNETFAKLRNDVDKRFDSQNVEQMRKNYEDLQRQGTAMKDLIEGLQKSVNNRPKDPVVVKLSEDFCNLQKSFTSLGQQVGEVWNTNAFLIEGHRQHKEELCRLNGVDMALGEGMVYMDGRLNAIEPVAYAAASQSALEQLQSEVRQLGERQNGTASSLKQARQAAARADEQLRKEKQNRFARLVPWVGDDFYQVIDRHQNSGARSGPVATFLRKMDGNIVAEVYEWSSYNGRPYATGKKMPRAVVLHGEVYVYDGYDAGGWPCQHRIPFELFPRFEESHFNSRAPRP